MKNILLFLSLVSPHALADIGAKSCHDFLIDSRAAGSANTANGAAVEVYLKQYGLEKTNQGYWHQSIVVHCIVNKGDTLLDATKQLIKELEGAK